MLCAHYFFVFNISDNRIQWHGKYSGYHDQENDEERLVLGIFILSAARFSFSWLTTQCITPQITLSISS